MRFLLVGDPHVTVEELNDSQALLDLILAVSKEQKPDYLVFLGDQHHNHSVIRVEVLDFWSKNLARFGEQKIVMLVGNHDRSHDVSLNAHGLRYAGSNVTIVSEPVTIEGVRYVPWMHEGFLEATADSKVVVCHQTFQGSKYENGFYAPDGVESDKMDANVVISGHIHTPQEFGKVWYPGAPRWRIATDANVDRAIWLVDIQNDQIVSRTPFTTRGHCKALYHFEDRGDPDIKYPEVVMPARVTVNVYGTPEYIKEKKTAWEGLGCRVATFPTQEARHAVRESEGITKALQRHVEAFKPRYGTPAEVLKKMVAERINV